MADEPRANTKPWICPDCGEANDGALCAKCGRSAPLEAPMPSGGPSVYTAPLYPSAPDVKFRIFLIVMLLLPFAIVIATWLLGARR